MKTIISVIFVLFTIYSCQQTKQQDGALNRNHKQKKIEIQFDEYVKTIDQIELPLRIKCNKELSGPLLPHADIVISKFGPENSMIFGKLAVKKKYTAIIYLSPADILLPIIQTTDKQGNKIASLDLYGNCNEDEFFKSTSWTTINKDLTIIISDSISTYKRDTDGEIINSTLKTKINHKRFYIDENGEIKESI